MARLPVRRRGNFLLNTTLGDSNGGEEDMSYAANGTGGGEEGNMISAAILEVKWTLRRAQVDELRRNDRIDSLIAHIRG